MIEVDKTLSGLQLRIHATAKSKGWYDEPRTFGDTVALAHSELSEALEEFRTHADPTHFYYRPSDQKPEGVRFELADTIIRILDTCAFYGIDIEAAVLEKMAFNETRESRHGGKAL